MPHLIEIRDESPRRLSLSHARIKKTASRILSRLGWKSAALSLWLVGDKKIHSLNKRFMNHDWATDVISFSQWEGKKLNVRGLSKKGKMAHLGDLIISLEAAERQAREYGNSFFYEFCFYLCHGVLHLMGWDDQKPEDAKRMEKKQTAILKKIGVLSLPLRSQGTRRNN